MNIVITGNPGTGKTSFTRLMFRFLRAHGILKRDAFVEKNPGEFGPKDWRGELAKSAVSYEGEEVYLATTLEFNRVVPALPPPSAGASADVRNGKVRSRGGRALCGRLYYFIFCLCNK